MVCGRRPHAASSVCLGPTSLSWLWIQEPEDPVAAAAFPGPDAGQSSGRGQAGGRPHRPTRILFCFTVQLNAPQSQFPFLLFLVFASLGELARKF